MNPLAARPMGDRRRTWSEKSWSEGRERREEDNEESGYTEAIIVCKLVKIRIDSLTAGQFERHVQNIQCHV